MGICEKNCCWWLTFWQPSPSTNTIHLTLKMTSAQVVKMLVTNNSSFQNYPHPDNYTRRTPAVPKNMIYSTKISFTWKRRKKTYILLLLFFFLFFLRSYQTSIHINTKGNQGKPNESMCTDFGLLQNKLCFTFICCWSGKKWKKCHLFFRRNISQFCRLTKSLGTQTTFMPGFIEITWVS